MTRRANFAFRVAVMFIMVVLLVYNQRIDAMLVGLLGLLATSAY